MLNYKNVYVVEDFDEAEQFRYEHNDQTVEVGTPVGFDRDIVGLPGQSPPAGGWDKNNKPVTQLICFEGIYFQSDE